MAALSIRDIDDDVRELLRVRAAEHGRSMEAEVRQILTDAVRPPRPEGLVDALLAAFSGSGAGAGADLELPARDAPPRAADLAP